MTALLTESEGVGGEDDPEEQENNPSEQEEDFESLFDDDNEEEEYKESVEEDDGQDTGAGDDVSALFGDVDDLEIEEEAQKNGSEEECKTLNKSREDLQGLFLYFLADVTFWPISPNASKGLILRGAQTHAGTDATAAAAAGSLPEGFQPVFRLRADSRGVSWSQTRTSQSEQGQVNHCMSEDGDPSR